MKKHTSTFLVIGVFVLTVIGVLYYRAGSAKPNHPLRLPDVNSVDSIVVETTDKNEYTYVTEEDIKGVYELLENAKNTGEESINDMPNVKPYGKIEIHNGNEAVTVFYYPKNGIFLFEQPYNGIYSTVEDLDMTFADMNQ